MSGFRKPGLPSPSRYKYIIEQELMGDDKIFTSDFTYGDLMLAMGPDAKGFTDISQVAKNFYSSYSNSLSEDLNPFYDFISSSGGVIDVNDNQVRWTVYSNPTREIQSLGNPNSDKVECLGLAGLDFYIRIDVQGFKPGNILAPADNKGYAVVVQEEGEPSISGGYDYRVKLLSDEGEFPVELLRAGGYWISMGAITSHMQSGQAGGFVTSMQYTYVQFAVNMTTMKWTYSIDEESFLKYGSIKVQRCNDDMRPIMGGRSIVSYMDMEAMNNIKRDTEIYMVYGRSSNNHIDMVSRENITTGPGLVEFMEQGIEIPYSPLSNGIDKIEREIRAYWFDRVPVSKRNIMLYTGEAGLELFHNWIMDKYGQSVVISNEDLILGTSTPFEAGRNGKSFGTLQFTKYYVKTFGSITVAHWPLLDNTKVNTQLMPGTHFPVSSYEYWAFDGGFGEPNIQLLTRNEKKLTQIYPGSIAPNGFVGPSNPIWTQASLVDYDGYKWSHRKSFGLVVLEPDRMLRFLPAIAA